MFLRRTLWKRKKVAKPLEILKKNYVFLIERTTSTSKRYEDGERNFGKDVVLNEFTMPNIEESQRKPHLESDLKHNEAYFFDSVHSKAENPLDSQSIKIRPLINLTTGQSFEDFRAKILSQRKDNEGGGKEKENIEQFKNFEEVNLKTMERNEMANQFDSANKNPMESESENDTEKNLVGSPIIQKSSRGFYTTAKTVSPNLQMRPKFKIID